MWVYVHAWACVCVCVVFACLNEPERAYVREGGRMCACVRACVRAEKAGASLLR